MIRGVPSVVRATLCALVILGALPFGAGPASGATFVYPGPAPCGGTLQACIDGVPSGSTIQVRKDVVLEDKLVIKKSLTLTRKPGTDPEISSEQQLRRVAVRGRSDEAVKVTIDNLSFDRVHIDVDFSQGKGNAFNLRRSELIAHPGMSNGARIVGIFGRQRHNRYELTDNLVVGEGQGIDAFASMGGPDFDLPSSRMDLLVQGNTLRSVDAPNSQAAITVGNFGGGRIDARIYNNVVQGGWGGCGCGYGSAIGFRSEDGTTTNWTATNNTVDGSDNAATYGIYPSPHPESGGSINVHNNIVVGTGVGFRIDADFPDFDTSIGINNLYDNVQNSFYGTNPHGTEYNLDPEFVDQAGGNLRLMATSDLINVGEHNVPGSVPSTDKDRQARVEEAIIDLGAFELGSRTDCSIVGTAGDDEINGRPQADHICGGPGEDTINGRLGKDRLFGGPDGDLLVGNMGADRLFGGEQADALDARDGVEGNDRLNGGPATDVCQGDPKDQKSKCP